MKTIEDIFDAIVLNLKNNLKNIKVYTSNSKEGFKRPCIYIKVVSDNINWIGTELLNSNQTIRLNYFPKHQHKNIVELNQIKMKLIELFGQKLVLDKNFIIPTSEIELRIVDNVLQFEFDLEYWQKNKDENPNEFIQSLDFDLKE